MNVRARAAAVTLITDALLRKWPLPTFDEKLGKEARGDVLIVGGSVQVPGAVLLAGAAALRAGAGRVQLGTARAVALHLAVMFPEARVIGLPQGNAGELSAGAVAKLSKEIEACRALLVGPGMCQEAAAASIVQHCQKTGSRCTLVLDAGALGVLRGRRPTLARYAAGVVATPHAGEMATLWGCERDEVLARPLELAREAARTLGIVLVMKGVETFVVTPEGVAYRNVAGNSGLATAGSGDTLSGIIAGLVARGAEPVQAAVWGVYLHAKAGEALSSKLGPLGFLARELPSEIPQLLDSITR